MINKTISDLVKRFGEGSVMLLSDAGNMQVETVSTGSLSLDIALGGGVPRGRIVEVYGPESSGKTSVCLHIIAEAQKSGGYCAFVDMEHALDPEYAAKLGVDLTRLAVSQPDSGEQALEIAEAFVRSGDVDVVVVDSVAALVPQREIEGDMGDAQMGAQARLMSQALRKLAGAVSNSKCILIFTNQIRMKVGVMFGNPETTSGGQALKFYASQRIDIRRVQTLKSGDEVLGNRTRATVVKNKVAPPFKKAEFDILFGKGISQEGEILDIGVKLNVITKRGAFFSYGELRLGQGRDNSVAYIKEHPGLVQELREIIMAAAGGGAQVVEPSEELESVEE